MKSATIRSSKREDLEQKKKILKSQENQYEQHATKYTPVNHFDVDLNFWGKNLFKIDRR